SATSQFYFNLADNKFLDDAKARPGYCVIGKVVEGMDIVDRIGKVKTNKVGELENVPDADVVILSARIETPSEPGWFQLFNGKDLTGWRAITDDKGVDAAKAWLVKGETLTCLGEPLGALHSVKSYRNYVLRFDVQFLKERGLAGSPAKIQI